MFVEQSIPFFGVQPGAYSSTTLGKLLKSRLMSRNTFKAINTANIQLQRLPDTCEAESQLFSQYHILPTESLYKSKADIACSLSNTKGAY